MSASDVLAYLIERQTEEKISAAAMARRLEISETQWCHLRKGRGGRRLTVAQIERAVQHYPEILELFAVPAAPEEKAS